jgi:hypothetical protein
MIIFIMKMSGLFKIGTITHKKANFPRIADTTFRRLKKALRPVQVALGFSARLTTAGKPPADQPNLPK